MRRVVSISSWIAGTVLGMVLASTAVQLAAANVSERTGARVTRPEVERELAVEQAASAAPSPPGTVPERSSGNRDTQDPASHPITTAAGAPAPPGPIPSAPVPAQPGPQGANPPGDDKKALITTTTGVVVPVQGPAPSTTEAPHGSPGGPPTTSPPPPVPPGPDQTFELAGGTVRVGCTGTETRLVSSSPKVGFTMTVKSSGPQEVKVEFRSATHQSVLSAKCPFGSLVPSVNESGDGPS